MTAKSKDYGAAVEVKDVPKTPKAKAETPEEQVPELIEDLTDTTRHFLLPKKRYTYSCAKNGKRFTKTMDNWIAELDPTDPVDELVIAKLESHPQAKDIDKWINPPADALFDVMSELNQLPVDALVMMLNSVNVLTAEEKAHWRHVADKTKLVGRILRLKQSGD